MNWTKPEIIKAIKRHYNDDHDMTYHGMTKIDQPLLSAAAYHFGSYRDAVIAAGINYADITRRPRWTRARIIQLIKQARRRNEPLNWAAVIRRSDELSRAAFAALQSRLFGNWDRALQAAGLDADEVCAYRRWTTDTVVAELRQRSANGEDMNSGTVQAEDARLHAAAVRHFKSFDTALKAAGIDPVEVRHRQTWTKDSVAAQMRIVARREKDFSGEWANKHYISLHSAAIRLYGTFAAAARAAKIPGK